MFDMCVFAPISPTEIFIASQKDIRDWDINGQGHAQILNTEDMSFNQDEMVVCSLNRMNLKRGINLSHDFGDGNAFVLESGRQPFMLNFSREKDGMLKMT